MTGNPKAGGPPVKLAQPKSHTSAAAKTETQKSSIGGNAKQPAVAASKKKEATGAKEGGEVE